MNERDGSLVKGSEKKVGIYKREGCQVHGAMDPVGPADPAAMSRVVQLPR